MKLMKSFILFCSMLCAAILPCKAQEVPDTIQAEEEYYLYYYRDGIDIKENYLNNAELIKRIKKVLSLSPCIDSVKIYAYASPEGPFKRNKWLAQKRVEAAREFILANVPSDSTLRPENVYLYPMGENWEGLKEELESNYYRPNRNEVMDIINSTISNEEKKLKLIALDDSTYEYIIRFHMPRLRIATWVCVYRPTPELHVDTPLQATLKLPLAKIPASIDKEINTDMKMPPDTYVWSRLYIKTNALALGMGIANIAAEIDLGERWSVTLPVYYSAWDYFTSTIKFRTFAVRPEARYWFSDGHKGLFAGAHLGMTYFNYAFGGDYRYQDKNKETPSLGGGLSVGYRMPISKNERWALEFTLGAGVYSLQYDKFDNTDNVRDGLMVDTKEKTYWGIDQAAVTFSYAIDLKKKIKKGGAK